MGYKAVDKGSDFTPCPEGNHLARVYQVRFLGTIPQTFKGETKNKPMVQIGFEFPNKLMEDGRPFVLSTMPIQASMNKKATFLKYVRGIVSLTPEQEKEFDIETLAGKTCLANVIHTEGRDNSVYANIVGCSPVPDGMAIPEAFNEVSTFDVTSSDLALIDELPEFIQKQVMESEEYKARIA